MSRTVASIIFLSLALIITGAIHYYMWIRLVRDTAMPAPWRLIATLGLPAAAVGLFFTFFIIQIKTPNAFKLVSYPLYIWMGLIFLFVVALLSTDLVKLALWAWRLVRGDDAPDPLRRVFVARVTAGAVSACVLSAAGWGFARAMSRVQIIRRRVTLRRLPRGLDGFSIAHLSDLHVGAPRGQRWLEGVIEQTNRLEPDLIAITGDLVDKPVEVLKDLVAPLARLKARGGVFFVTGNHEYYHGADAWIAELERLGIRVLRNQRVSVGRGDASFDLAGIDDHQGRRLPGHGPDLARALDGRDPGRELVLLAHQPKAIHDAARHDVGLMLAGHTHGGQIWPIDYLVRLDQPYLAGLVTHGPTILNVSQGTGFWGPPFRLGSRSEIVLVELKARARVADAGGVDA